MAKISGTCSLPNLQAQWLLEKEKESEKSFGENFKKMVVAQKSEVFILAGGHNLE